MKKFSALLVLVCSAVCICGCHTAKLPSEDIEIFEKHGDIIAVLKNPDLPPNSKEKYDAAMKLVDNVDLYFTRETATVNKIFHYRDAIIDGIDSDNPVFSFQYQHADKTLRIRFFTYKMFVTRVEIKEL